MAGKWPRKIELKWFKIREKKAQENEENLLQKLEVKYLRIVVYLW